MTRTGLTPLAVLVALLGLATPAAEARDLMWLFQDTGYDAYDPFEGSTATALRSDRAWPVIFAPEVAYGLFATPGPQDSYWHTIGSMPFDPNASLVAKSSSDGRVLAFGRDPNDQRRVVVGHPAGGFQAYSADAGAFGPDGALALVTNIPGLQGSERVVDMAIASDGTKGFVTTHGAYVEQRAGQWDRVLLDEMDLDLSEEPLLDGLRLAFDPQNRPHIGGRSEEGEIFTARFDTAAAQWQVNHLGYAEGGVAMASTTIGDGEVGLAWADETTLHYALFGADQQWITTEVTTDAELPFHQSVGLDFDWEGLPVISYIQDGRYFLAYDPVPVPEPTAATILALAGGALMLRRRRTG